MNIQLFLQVLVFILIPAVVFIADHLLVILSENSSQYVREYFGNHSLLVTAHPDDESMFFGPTIMNLPKEGKYLTILCMTIGDTIEITRAKELQNVVNALGPNVQLKLLNDPNLPDSMNIDWNTNYTADRIRDHLTEHGKSISTIVSFDSHGVSGHKNHRSISSAIKEIRLSNEISSHITFLELKSVTIWRKYTAFLDSIITWLEATGDIRGPTLAIDFNEHSNLKQILRLHESQMLWYRQIYMLFSRYMFINDFELYS